MCVCVCVCLIDCMQRSVSVDVGHFIHEETFFVRNRFKWLIQCCLSALIITLFLTALVERIVQTASSPISCDCTVQCAVWYLLSDVRISRTTENPTTRVKNTGQYILTVNYSNKTFHLIFVLWRRNGKINMINKIIIQYLYFDYVCKYFVDVWVKSHASILNLIISTLLHLNWWCLCRCEGK